MTAVSAIVFFLGLLFGFQRPSRLLPLRLCATVLLLLCCTPFNPGAAFFISKRLFCQAAVAAAFHRFASSGFNIALSRFVSSFRAGRGIYFASASRVNSLRRLSLPLRPGVWPVRLHRFEGRRLLPPPRWESTSLADFLFPLSLLSAGASVASATSPFRPRGAASTTAALGVNRLRRLSSSLPPGFVAAATSALSGARLLPPPR